MCLEWLHLYAVRGGGTVSCKLNHHVVREDWPAVFKNHRHKREGHRLTAGNGEKRVVDHCWVWLQKKELLTPMARKQKILEQPLTCFDDNNNNFKKMPVICVGFPILQTIMPL